MNQGVSDSSGYVKQVVNPEKVFIQVLLALAIRKLKNPFRIFLKTSPKIHIKTTKTIKRIVLSIVMRFFHKVMKQVFRLNFDRNIADLITTSFVSFNLMIIEI